MSTELPPVVFTTFAGRKENLEVQFLYTDKLLAKGLIQEVHLWNFTREVRDSIWLKHALNASDPFIYRAPNRQYRNLPLCQPLNPNNNTCINIRVRGAHDAHIILVSNRGDVYEIIIGNTKSAIGTPHGEIASYIGPIMSTTSWSDLQINLSNSFITIKNNNQVILQSLITTTDYQIALAGSMNCSIDFDLEPIKDLLNIPGCIIPPMPNRDTRYKLMDVKDKFTWREYYAYYTQERYPNHVIIKSDDDIVFIEVDSFEQFIRNRLANPDVLMWIPTIINNGACAYYQQKMGLIPKEVGEFPYDTFNGKLWSSVELCTRLHEFFTSNHKAFTTVAKYKPPIMHPIGDRISINFFAFLSKDLHIYPDVYTDDEYQLSIVMALKYARRHVIDSSMTVAHLSFCKQVEMGLDCNSLLQRYRAISESV